MGQAAGSQQTAGNGSAGKAAFVKEGLLLGRGRAPKKRIAMREAAEAANDLSVPVGMRKPGLPEPGVQRDRQILVGCML